MKTDLSYGAKGSFTRVAYVQVVNVGWVSGMTWSRWVESSSQDAGGKLGKSSGPSAYLGLPSVKAQLALTTIDGAVRLVDIVQSWPLESSSVTVSSEQVRMLDAGDKRSIAAIQWVDVSCS
jgi:hypothetical protein